MNSALANRVFKYGGLLLGLVLIAIGFRHIVRESHQPVTPAEIDRERIRKNDDSDHHVLDASKASDAEVYGALIRLAQKQDPQARREALRHAGDASAQARAGAANALGYFGDAESTKALDKLVTDSDENVRTQAIRGLGHLQSPERVERLDAIAARPGTSPREHLAALSSLITAASDPARQSRAIDGLVQLALSPPNALLGSEAAVDALSAAPRDERVVKMLRTMIEKGELPQVISVAVRHLAAIQDPWYRTHARKIQESTDPQVRLAAVQSINFACPPDRVALLREAANPKDVATFPSAVQQLARIPGAESHAALEVAVKRAQEAKASDEVIRTAQNAVIDQRNNGAPDPCAPPVMPTAGAMPSPGAIPAPGGSPLPRAEVKPGAAPAPGAPISPVLPRPMGSPGIPAVPPGARTAAPVPAVPTGH